MIVVDTLSHRLRIFDSKLSTSFQSPDEKANEKVNSGIHQPCLWERKKQSGSEAKENKQSGSKAKESNRQSEAKRKKTNKRSDAKASKRSDAKATSEREQTKRSEVKETETSGLPCSSWHDKAINSSEQLEGKEREGDQSAQFNEPEHVVVVR